MPEPDYGDWGHPLWLALGEAPGEPYVPFDWQRDLVHKKHMWPRLVGACGRRAGKTLSMRAEVVRDAVPVGGTRIPPLVYVAAPNYELSQKIFEPIWRAFTNVDGPLHFLHASHDSVRRIIDLKNGARIQAKSGDNPTTIQGDRVTAAYVDEAQDFSEEAWANLMPGLLDSNGKLRAIGIPKGNNRFRTYYSLGETNEDRFSSFSVPSSANPMIDQQWIEDMRLEHTDDEFRRLYLAEWVEQDGLVFRNLDDVFVGAFEEPERDDLGKLQNGPFIMGLDIGKMEDYTVAYVLRPKDMKVVAVERFRGLDYILLGERIAQLYRRYDCHVVHMDATGVGEPAADILRNNNCSVSPYVFTRESKAKLIGRLILAIERREVVIPKDDLVLRKEMELFQATVTPGSVTPRYEHPKGYHDDCVIALALAVFKAWKRRGLVMNPNQRPYVTFNKRQARRQRRKVAV